MTSVTDLAQLPPRDSPNFLENGVNSKNVDNEKQLNRCFSCGQPTCGSDSELKNDSTKTIRRFSLQEELSALTHFDDSTYAELCKNKGGTECKPVNAISIPRHGLKGRILHLCYIRFDKMNHRRYHSKIASQIGGQLSKKPKTAPTPTLIKVSPLCSLNSKKGSCVVKESGICSSTYPQQIETNHKRIGAPRDHMPQHILGRPLSGLTSKPLKLDFGVPPDSNEAQWRIAALNLHSKIMSSIFKDASVIKVKLSDAVNRSRNMAHMNGLLNI